MILESVERHCAVGLITGRLVNYIKVDKFKWYWSVWGVVVVRRAGPMLARARHGGGRCGLGRGVRGGLACLAAARLRSRALPGAELPPRLGTTRVPRGVSRLSVPSGQGQVRPTLLSCYTDIAPWSRYQYEAKILLDITSSLSSSSGVVSISTSFFLPSIAFISTLL